MELTSLQNTLLRRPISDIGCSVGTLFEFFLLRKLLCGLFILDLIHGTTWVNHGLKDWYRVSVLANMFLVSGSAILSLYQPFRLIILVILLSCQSCRQSYGQYRYQTSISGGYFKPLGLFQTFGVYHISVDAQHLCLS